MESNHSIPKRSMLAFLKTLSATQPNMDNIEFIDIEQNTSDRLLGRNRNLKFDITKNNNDISVMLKPGSPRKSNIMNKIEF